MFYELGDRGTGYTAEAFKNGLDGVYYNFRPSLSLTTIISPVFLLEQDRIFIRIITVRQTWQLYHRVTVRVSPS